MAAVAFEPSPELVELGLALGLLTGTVDSPGFDNTFFDNPGDRLAGILSNPTQRTAALDLLSRVLDGAPGPGAIGGEQWVPLVTTDTTPRLGLWGIVREQAGGAVDLSLAVLVRHDDAVGLELSLTVPLVRLGSNGVADFLAGGPDGVIRLDVGVELGDAVALGDLSIESFALALGIPTDGSDPTVEVRAEVPPSGAANDLVLDSSSDLGGQLVELLLRFGAAAAGDAADELAELLDLLGLGTDDAIPGLPLEGLLDDPVGSLWSWVQSLATPQTITAWVGHLVELVGADPVSGTGTVTDPAKLCVQAGPAEICLTFAVDTTGAAPVLLPGLALRATAPSSFASGGDAALTATLARITLGAEPSAELAPALSATVTLGDPTTAGELLDVDMPTVGSTKIDAIRAGIVVGADGVAPLLEAHGVDIGDAGTFDVLDLTDTDALLDVAGAALDAVVTNVLTALGADDTAEALLVLAGIRRPEGETAATWPEEVALTSLFSDPVGAVAGYHRTVLVAGRWPVLGAHLVRLLGTPVALDAATGGGTGLDPWRIELADTAVGTAQLLAWTSTDADGFRLHLGVELVPAALALTETADGPVATLQTRVSLLSLRLAAADGSAAAPDPVALASLGATIELSGGLRLDAGFAAVDADRITAGVLWDRTLGLQPAFAVTGAELVALPDPIAIPLPRLDPATGRWIWDDDIPWAVLERLLAMALEASANLLVRDTARLLGWRDSGGARRPAVPPLANVPTSSQTAPSLDLEVLVADPLGALGDWGVELLSGPQGQEWAEQLLGWVARAAGGAAAGIAGSGAASDPWAAPLGTSGRTRLAMARGDAGAPLGRSIPPVPLAVTDASEGVPGMGAPPSLQASVLARAANSLPSLREVLDRGLDVGDALAALVGSLTDTDGLVPRTSQLALSGATTVIEEGIGLATGAFQFRPERHLIDGPAETARIFVRVAGAGVLDWADVDPSRVIDLTDPTLSAPAFDLSRISGPGPWFVVLPSRAATGIVSAASAHLELVARLTRVVIRAAAELGTDVALVAHGSAGLVARHVSATVSNISHLTTIATAHAGAAVDLANTAAATGFRVLQSLRGLIPDPRGDLPFADEVLAALEATLDTPAPGVDGSPAPSTLAIADADPAGAIPALPASVTATAVANVFTASDLERALAEVTRYAIRAGIETVRAAADGDADRGGTSVGYRADAVRPSSGGGVRVGVTVGPDLFSVTRPDPGGDTGAPPIAGPRLVVRTRLDHATGWLVGSAAASLRVRAADVELITSIGSGGVVPSLTIALHDAGVMGTTRTRWVIDLADATRLPHLLPDERLLLGGALEALGPVPATGPVRAVAELLAALGVVSIATDNTVTADLTSIETALTGVGDVLGAATVAARTDAIAAVESLLGAAGVVDLGDGFELEVDLDARNPASLTLRTTGTGVDLPLGFSLGGSVAVDMAGHVTADIEISAPGASANQRAVVGLTVDTASIPVASAAIRLVDRTGSTARSVALLPVPDSAGLVDLVSEVAPAALLQLALGALRREVPASAGLLDVLGLGAPDEPVRLPATLLADPVDWFLDTASLGAATGRPDPGRIVDVINAARAFVGDSGPADTLHLPWGLALSFANTGGDLDANLTWPSPLAAGPVRLGGTLGLRFTAAGELEPSLATTVDIVDGGGTDIGGLSLGVATTGVTAAGRVGGTTIPLLPGGPGLGALAAGATKALPIVLDAAAGAPAPVGPAVEALGNALGLRDGTGFVETELVALGTDPGQQLVDRLRTNIGGTLTALEAFVDPIFPSADVVEVVGNVVTIEPVDGLTISIDLGPLAQPTPAPPRICVTVTGLEPVDGLAISATACVSDGPDEISVSVAVTDADLLLGLLPEIRFAIGRTTTTPNGQVDLALWTGVPTDAARTALVGIADLGAGAVAVRCRHHDGSDHLDLGPCGAALVTEIVLPRLLDLVLSVDDVKNALENKIGTGPRIGELFAPELLTRSTGGGIRYTVTPSAFRLTELPGRALRTLVSGLGQLLGDLPLPGLEPLTIGIATDTDNGLQRIGLHLGIERTKDLELVSGDGIRLAIEADGRWVARALGQDPETFDAGLDLFLLTMPAGAAAVPELDPRIAIRGIGLRAEHSSPGQKLLDIGLTLRSIGVHGWYERSLTGSADEKGGGHIELDQFGLPVGSAGGNAVASSFVKGDGSGDDTDTSPAFSPALSVWSDGGPPQVDLRAGEGDGPWWIPIQQAFGPIYIDQLGFGVGRDGTDIESVSVLLDGGASMAGLTIALDDLEVIVPWNTPLDVTTWRLDLAGFAVGYSGSGLTVAGGLKKFDRDGNPDYVGMIQVSFPPYGATGVGAYGVFPDGAGDEYTSFFAFVAVTAPIGGPPIFFVTGLGGGFGLNRELIAPDITEVETFPLVAAFTGSMADDPMGALETLGDTFPPKRGALWFAAGLSFTTFALVNTTAVITVAIDGGLELNLFGLSKMQLPPAPAPAMASVELALHARFSSQEAVLSVQAQLTDNSWIVNRSVRLTGGFAFIIWFRTGQFVFSIGGYGPAFDKPSTYPDIPRVGFCWEPSGKVVIKGGGYFCLTSSCVMAGGEIEVAYRSGSVWAALEAGLHILVSWDPFAYDFRFYVSLSAGVRWKTFLGTISFSFSFGVYVHIEGPELRGSATLDLDVVSVTVRFGPSSSPNSDARIGFDTFLSDYVLEPPGDTGARHALAASVTEGQLVAGTAATGGGEADPDTADDGSSARPWRVVPEFAMAVQTRAATNSMPDIDEPLLPAVATGQLDTGPTGNNNVNSELCVQVLDGTTDHAGDIHMTAEYGYVPEAVWREMPVEPDVAEEKTILTCVGVRFTAGIKSLAAPRTIDIDGVEVGRKVHPLPFLQERQAVTGLAPLRKAADSFRKEQRFDGAASVADLVAGFVADSSSRQLRAGDALLADVRLRPDRILEDRAAPPQLVSIAQGIGVKDRPKVTSTAREQTIDVPDATTVGAPRLESVVRSAAADAFAGSGATGLDLEPTTASRVRGDRIAPPTLDGVRADLGHRLGAELRREMPAAKALRGTLVIGAALPRTAAAGAGRQRLLVGGRESGAGKLAATAARQLTRTGTRVRPGDTQVWVRDNSAAEARDAARPSLQVDGTARVLALDRGGRAQFDATVSDRTVEIPVGAARIVIVGGSKTDSASGWVGTDAVTEVADGAWLATNALIRSAGSRGGSRANRSGTVRASTALSRSGRIETDLAANARTIVIALDGVEGGIPELAIEGAEPAGKQRAVRHGGQTVLVAPIKVTADHITVGVAPNEGTVVGGVIGSPLDVDAVVGTLAAGGLGAISPRGAATGSVATITWKDAR